MKVYQKNTKVLTANVNGVKEKFSYPLCESVIHYIEGLHSPKQARMTKASRYKKLSQVFCVVSTQDELCQVFCGCRGSWTE